MYSFCTGWYALSSNKKNTNCSSVIVTKDEDVQPAQFDIKTYTFLIPRITTDLNESTFAVSLTRDGTTVQWKRVAWLTVTPATEMNTPLIVSSLVPLLVVIIVLGSVINIVLRTVQVIKKKRRYSRITVNEGI